MLKQVYSPEALDHTIAECSETKARLSRSYGRLKRDHPMKWYVEFSELWHSFPVKAWTPEEAIEVANKRLMEQYKIALKVERVKAWYQFIEYDQQATCFPNALNGFFPDDHARLWAQHPAHAVDEGA